MAEYLARDLTMLQEINPDTISLSPFVPREGTSFRHQLPCNLETFLRLTAILRVMFPKANIAASPLVNSIHVQGQVMAIYSGANVLRVPSSRRPCLASQGAVEVFPSCAVSSPFMRAFLAITMKWS
ncbi:hypothetical protein M5E89_06450 [Acidaminococcus intestini]|nr:hypothetical protein M5E89_06450 [Acidaminococcus intestini]